MIVPRCRSAPSLALAGVDPDLMAPFAETARAAGIAVVGDLGRVERCDLAPHRIGPTR